MKLHTREWSGSADQVPLSDAYDLVIAGASWDSRCMVMAGLEGLAAAHALIVKYEDVGSSGRSEAHERRLSQRFARMDGLHETDVRVDSYDLDASWAALRDQILDTYSKVSRPLDVLIDLTSIPRNLSLGLLGFGLRSGVAQSFDFFYAAASDYCNAGGTDASPFTMGYWKPWSIAGLGGTSPARARQHLVVSAGFEGDRTRRLVDSLEPDRVSIVFAEPGSSPEAEERARLENHMLAETYLLPATAMHAVPLASPLAARDAGLAAASAIEIDEVFPEDTSFLLCGPKTHSLGLAIASLVLESGDVLYVQPEAHSENDSLDVSFVTLTHVAYPWAVSRQSDSSTASTTSV